MNKESKYTDTQKPLVAIHCMVYNHAPYLRDCFEGFVMQQTNFSFVAIVHDDASTDNSADIIREYATKYPHIFKPIYQTENQYSKPGVSVVRLINEAILKTGAKYIAMCEGDDYWTDPFKLQKQVDFMEHHPDYGLCYSKVMIHYESMSTQHRIEEWGGNAETFNELLRANAIPTLTTLYRAELSNLYANDIRPEQRRWKMGDYPMWLWIAQHYNIKYFDTHFGNYRILERSASHSPNPCKNLEFFLSATNIKLFFAKKYMPSRLPYLLIEKFYRHLKIWLYTIKTTLSQD